MKTKASILLLILTWASHSLLAQTNIHITVEQSFSPLAKLYIYHGEKTVFVDSSWQKSQGEFFFSLPQYHQEGVYKVVVGKNAAFDILIANEPSVKVKTIVFAPEDSLKVIESEENKVFQAFVKQKKRYKQQTWHINSLLDFYSEGSMFHSVLSAEKYRVENTYAEEVKTLASANRSLLASKLIFLDVTPVTPPILDNSQAKATKLQQWWDNIDLTDNRLTSTASLLSRLWGYAELLMNDELDKEQQDSAFIAGIAALFNKDISHEVATTFRESLKDGFYDSGYLQTEHYLNGVNFPEITPMERTADGLWVGDTAPNFKFQSLKGDRLKLSKVSAKYKLIMFWSSWCPHCIEELPLVVKVYEKYKDKGFEVIAINIDEERSLWEKVIKDHNANWINAIEPDDGNSKLLKIYHVDETPKFYMLNDKLQVISKPSNAKQIEAKLRRVFKE